MEEADKGRGAKRTEGRRCRRRKRRNRIMISDVHPQSNFVSHLRYCRNDACQSQRPVEMKCKQCGVSKERQSGFRHDGLRHWSERCKACEFPTCGCCGKAYTGTRAVYSNNPQIVNAKWYCKDDRCKIRVAQESKRLAKK